VESQLTVTEPVGHRHERAASGASPGAAAGNEVDVLIVGAGVSGIGVACTLAAECPGKTVAIVERRPRLGGTWDLFRYPGVRSDSDMLTYGYGFRPWHEDRVMADGPSIRRYLADTAREHGVDARIRFGARITRADWSSADQRWTLEGISEPGREPGGQPLRWRCRHLVMATGYYDHEAGHTPDLPGLEHFRGVVVHPQHWPESLDWRGRRVVVIGSGATAMTLVPALAAGGAQVTLLQRSPSYVLSLPSRDRVSTALARLLPERWVYAWARRRNIAVAMALYRASRRWPNAMRWLLLRQVARQLRGAADMRHFTPAYRPWDQRLCMVPDGDLFAAIRRGQATLVTDTIAGFDARHVRLQSGQALEADIVVTATGLELQAMGGMAVAVDGRPWEPGRHMFYRGVLLQDLPNLAWIVGYTNASWTLKVDLAAAYLSRLVRHMDANGLGVATPRDTVGCALDDVSILDGLAAGYVARGGHRVPRQGRRDPWRVTHDLASDRRLLAGQTFDDGVLVFEPLKAGAGGTGPFL
jgi:cation diffusion facilitator CzcD-associated flavoprotein CzcO